MTLLNLANYKIDPRQSLADGLSSKLGKWLCQAATVITKCLVGCTVNIRNISWRRTNITCFVVVVCLFVCFRHTYFKYTDTGTKET